MTTIIRAAHAAQFLSFLPAMLGCIPTRSLVLIPFARSRSIGAIRFDLPDDADRDQVASTCVGMVCRLADAEEVTAVVYTDEPIAGGDPHDSGTGSAGAPHAELIEALRLRADACGLHLRDALCVASDAWCSYLADGAPHPLDEIAPDPQAGSVPDGDQLSGTELPELARGEAARVADGLGQLAEAVRVLCGDDATTARGKRRAAARIDPRALAAACRLDDITALFEEALGLDPAALDPYTAALLVWALTRPAFRDIALMQWVGGPAAGDAALQAQLRWEAGEEYPAELGERMWGEGPRPDLRRMDAALALARRIAACAPPAHRAGPLAACGWLSWALGRSTHAAVYATAACEAEPEHGLGEIVLSFTQAGHLPAWAFETASRRHPMPPQ